MIKLKNLITEGHGEDVDMDRLYWQDSYLDDVAEKFGYPDNFSKRFWSNLYLPTLYHCTSEENYELIKSKGLTPMDKTRGFSSNRHLGPAIFTTSEEDEVPHLQQSYGPIALAINTTQMKKDGFMPAVSKEPDWERAEKIEFVLHKLGQEDAEASTFVDSSDQNTQGTVIVYSDIPLRYLSLVE